MHKWLVTRLIYEKICNKIRTEEVSLQSALCPHSLYPHLFAAVLIHKMALHKTCASRTRAWVLWTKANLNCCLLMHDLCLLLTFQSLQSIRAKAKFPKECCWVHKTRKKKITKNIAVSISDHDTYCHFEKALLYLLARSCHKFIVKRALYLVSTFHDIRKTGEAFPVFQGRVEWYSRRKRTKWEACLSNWSLYQWSRRSSEK